MCLTSFGNKNFNNDAQMLTNAKMNRVIQMQNATTLMDISIVCALMILLEMEHFALQVWLPMYNIISVSALSLIIFQVVEVLCKCMTQIGLVHPQILNIINMKYCMCTCNPYIHFAVGKTDHEEMSEVVIVSVTVAVICIVIIIVIVNTAILCLVFTGKRKQKFDKTWILSEIDGPPEFPNEGEKEQQKDDNTQLLPETEGPLEFPDEEERMFEQKESLGCQRFVPAMVELYENIASGAVKPEDLLDEQAENVITRID